jgi:hypothetical protein
MAAVDAHALVAEALLDRYRPERIPELLQVQGQALVNGTHAEAERGVAMLLRAVELREEQLAEQRGSREWLSQARESYALGLAKVRRASDAIVYFDLALSMHEEEFGHANTWRTRTILMQKFLALLELRRLDESESVADQILRLDHDQGAWPQYCDDALWLAAAYKGAAATWHATKFLTFGHHVANEHGLVGHTTAFDRAREPLG